MKTMYLLVPRSEPNQFDLVASPGGVVVAAPDGKPLSVRNGPVMDALAARLIADYSGHEEADACVIGDSDEVTSDVVTCAIQFYKIQG